MSNSKLTLRDVREMFGLSQVELSKRAGMSLASVAVLDKSTSVPTRITAKKLAKVYGVQAYVLRMIAIQATEELPAPGKNRDRFMEFQRMCQEAVSERTTKKVK